MPNASWRRRGGKAQWGGVSPIRSKAEDERSEGLHKHSAEDCWETPAPRQGSALSEVWFPYSCAQAHRIFRVALRQEQAAVVGSGECAAVAAREETLPRNGDAGHVWAYCELRIANFRAMSEDVSGTGTHRPGVWKPL